MSKIAPFSTKSNLPVNVSRTEPEQLLNLAALLLSRIPSDDRQRWINVGIILKSSIGSEAYHVWRNWSLTSAKSSGTNLEQEWRSLGESLGDSSGNRLHFGTLMQYAEDSGMFGGISARNKWFTALRAFGFERSPAGAVRLVGKLPDEARELLGEGKPSLELVAPQAEKEPSSGEVAAKAKRIWAEGRSGARSRYMEGKELPEGRLRTEGSGRLLLVPYYNRAEEIRQLQKVGANGKWFLPGRGSLEGLYGALSGPLSGSELAVVVTEGVGDAGAVAFAMEGSKPPVVSVLAGSLARMEATISLVRSICHRAVILVAADRDDHGHVAGGATLLKAADQVGASVALPAFSMAAEVKADWCDLYQLEGAEVLREQIREGLSEAWNEYRRRFGNDPVAPILENHWAEAGVAGGAL